jgi:hypothetical protein
MHGDQGWWHKYINNTIIARRNVIYNLFGEVNSTDNMTSDEFLFYVMKLPVFVHSTFTNTYFTGENNVTMKELETANLVIHRLNLKNIVTYPLLLNRYL